MSSVINTTSMINDKATLLAALLEMDDPDFFKNYEDQRKLKKEQQKQSTAQKIKEIEDKIKAEKTQQEQHKKRQEELEVQLKQLKTKSGERVYKEFVNPSNPNEVYRTGAYKPWMKEMAKKDGIDIFNDKAMKKWIKENLN